MKIISILILSLIVFQTNPTIWDLLTDNNKVEIFKEIEKQQENRFGCKKWTYEFIIEGIYLTLYGECKETNL